MKQIKQLFTGRRKNMYILAILFVLCLATELLLANWRDFSIKDAPVTVLPSETLTSAKGATLLPDGTIQIFYRKSDGVLYAVNGSAAKLQDGEAIAICSESAQIAAADIAAEAFARLKRISV